MTTNKRKIEVAVELLTGSFDKLLVYLDEQRLIRALPPTKGKYEEDGETSLSPAQVRWSVEADTGAEYKVTIKDVTNNRKILDGKEHKINDSGYSGDEIDV